MSTTVVPMDGLSEPFAAVRDERRAQFVGAALARRANFRATGRTISFEDMEAYALAAARGEQRPNPPAKKR